jgi:hypothetical protein
MRPLPTKSRIACDGSTPVVRASLVSANKSGNRLTSLFLSELDIVQDSRRLPKASNKSPPSIVSRW